MPAPSIILVDFGRVAFGNLELTAHAIAADISVHFGEDFINGRINRQPPGTVRYLVATPTLQAGTLH